MQLYFWNNMTVTMGSENQEISTKVTVQKPKYELTYYVSYEITTETNSPCFSVQKSAIRRRYSEFLWLYKTLSKEFPAVKCPLMPPKFPFKDHFNPTFVEKRRALLDEFLNKILSTKIYLSSKALHFFLQSNMTVDEIKEAVRGKSVHELTMKDEVISRTKDIALSSASSASSFNDNDNSDHKACSQSEEPKSSDCCNLSEDSSDCNHSNSPPGNKRVSFCEQVTVAQIHTA